MFCRHPREQVGFERLDNDARLIEQDGALIGQHQTLGFAIDRVARDQSGIFPTALSDRNDRPDHRLRQHLCDLAA